MTTPDPIPARMTAEDVSRVPVCVVMRFCYLGSSGWKSVESRTADLLFDRGRLELRLRLLRDVALASLSSQDDPDFHLYVLTGETLPGWARGELDAVIGAAIGADRATVDARPPGPARKHLRNFLRRRYGGERTMQVVLDDDDGLAVDFVSRLRTEMRAVLPERTARTGDPFFISFPHGYGLALHGAARLYRHRYPYINLGLSMLSRPDGRNLLGIGHKKAPRRFGCHLAGGAPMWVRSVHSSNDSRVEVTPRWQPVADWSSDADVTGRFPYLAALADA